MSKADDIFYREFAVILLLLTLFTIAMIFVARAIGGNAFEEMRNSEQNVLERISPVGAVRIGEPGKVMAAEASETMQVAAAQPAASDSGGKSGEAVYGMGCVACHAAGVAGAPKLGDKAAWEPRTAQGIDALVSSVLNGKGAMPPKGGVMSLTEPEIKKAVEYMLEKSGLAG